MPDSSPRTSLPTLDTIVTGGGSFRGNEQLLRGFPTPSPFSEQPNSRLLNSLRKQ